MTEREYKQAAMRPRAARWCIVMACTDLAEAKEVSRLLSEVNSGCLVTYRRSEDLMRNAPTGKVALVILATEDPPAAVLRVLNWLRGRWPGCPLTVVGDAGCGEHEMAAREGGAFYLTRPVGPEEWSAVLAAALQAAPRAGSRSEGAAVRKTGR